MGMTRPGDDIVHRGEADDLAGGAGSLRYHTPAQEFLCGLAGGEELPDEVDAEHLFPVFQRHVDERRMPLQIGVIDQDVDASVDQARCASAGRARIAGGRDGVVDMVGV